MAVQRVCGRGCVCVGTWRVGMGGCWRAPMIPRPHLAWLAAVTRAAVRACVQDRRGERHHLCQRGGHLLHHHQLGVSPQPGCAGGAVVAVWRRRWLDQSVPPRPGYCRHLLMLRALPACCPPALLQGVDWQHPCAEEGAVHWAVWGHDSPGGHHEQRCSGRWVWEKPGGLGGCHSTCVCHWHY